ncbi:hypothetical protein WJX74_003300 [Apatococcus lobatus]|uniref:Uncharacterized protein n=1 Tax=Apatococcus lobatus TaxID=904363 RepID=A0AAW1QZW0_9CHLO
MSDAARTKMKASRMAGLYPSHGKPSILGCKAVARYNLNGDLQEVYASIARAAESLGGQSSSIGRACRGTLQMSCGFQWREVPHGADAPLRISPHVPRTGRKIVQLLGSDVVATHARIGAAAKAIGVVTSGISSVLGGRQLAAKGFTFAYEDEWHSTECVVAGDPTANLL